MHEATLISEVISVIEERVKTEKLGKVKVVLLEVGALAAVELEALEFMYEALKEGTRLEGARLEIVKKSAKAMCGLCEKNFEISSYRDVCPICGSLDFKIIEGDQIFIKNIEVEDN